MKKIYCCLILAFAISPLFSQTPLLDSLYKRLQQDPTHTPTLLALGRELRFSNLDSVQIIAQQVLRYPQKDYHCQAYTLLGNYFHAQGILDSARFYYTRSLHTATPHKPEEERIATLLNLSNLMYFEGNTDHAIDTLNKILQEVPTLKDPVKRKRYEGKAKSMLADFYKEIGVEDLSIKYYLESIQFAEKDNDLNEASASWIGLGKLYFNIKEYQKSIDAYKKAIAITFRSNNVLYRANAYNVIGYAFLELSRPDSAAIYQQEAEKILRATESASDWLSNKVLKGQIALKKNDPGTALLYFREALQVAYDRQMEPDRYISFENMGDAFLANKQFDSAIHYFTLSERYYVVSNYTEELKNTRYKLLQSALRKKGDSTSMALLAAFDSAQNKYLNDKKIQLIKAQEVKFETALKEEKLAKQAIELKASHQQNTWLLIGALALALISTILIWLYQTIRRKNSIIAGQKAEILHFHDNSLRQLRSMFRRQSVRQLHADDSPSNEERVRVLSLLHEHLHGEDGLNGDLKAFLEKLCMIKSKEADLPIQCEVATTIRIKPALIKDIGIITNEIITNAVKHAFDDNSHKSISLRVALQNNVLLISITDNGKGLPANFSLQNAAGFGMGYVGDLIEQHNGQLNYYNKNGAHFDIKIDLSHA